MSTGLSRVEGGGKIFFEPLERRRRQRGETAPGRFECIKGQEAGGAAIGQDRKAVAGLRPGQCQGLGGIEQFGHAVDAQHAGAPECGVVSRVAAERGAGAGGGEAGAGARVSRLQHENRLAARGGARRRHEFAAVGDALDIEQDRACAGVGGEIVEHVAKIDVGHVAERNDMRKADAARCRPIEHRRDHGARLADEGDIARQRRARCEAGVEAAARHDHTDAVRADEAQEMRPGRVERRPLPAAPAVAPPAKPGAKPGAKPRAKEDRGLGAALAEPCDEDRDRFGRGRDHGQVRGARQARQVRVDRDPVDRPPMFVDQQQLAAESGTAQVAQHDAADRARSLGRGEERDRARVEQLVEVADRHRAEFFTDRYGDRPRPG